MKTKLMLLLAASSGLTLQAHGERSLQEAIDQMLANNCRGMGMGGGMFSGGLLGAFEVEESFVSEVDDDSRASSFSLSVFGFDENDQLLPDDLGVPNAWLSGNDVDVPGSHDGVFGLSIEQLENGDFSLSLNIPSEEQINLLSIEDQQKAGEPGDYFNYGGQLTTNSVVFDGLVEPVALNLLPAPGASGLPIGTSENTVRAVLTEVQPVLTITATRPTLGVQEELGQDLISACTTQSMPQAGERITQYSSDFINTNADGGTFGVAGPVTGTPPNAQVFSGTSGGASTQAVQDRQLTLRRDQSLWARIQRLVSRGDRQRQRQERERERQALQPYRLASAGGVVPGPRPTYRDFSFVTDVSGGALSVDRSATELEGAFSADSLIVNAAAGVMFHGDGAEGATFLVGGALSYEETEADGESPAANGQSQSLRTETESEAVTASAFMSWTSGPLGGGPDGEGRINLSASYSSGQADTRYSRDFQTTIFRLEGDDMVTDRILDESYRDSVDQSFDIVTLRGSYSFTAGNLSIGPRASASWVRFETDDHAEEATSSNAALALRYEAVEDEWTEFRVGAGASYRVRTSSATALRLGAGVDAIIVDDAETPERTAFFVQDLRTNPTPIVYSVDDLDSEYYDVNFSIALENNSSFEPYISAFTRQGHDFLDMEGGVIGVRAIF